MILSGAFASITLKAYGFVVLHPSCFPEPPWVGFFFPFAILVLILLGCYSLWPAPANPYSAVAMFIGSHSLWQKDHPSSLPPFFAFCL